MFDKHYTKRRAILARLGTERIYIGEDLSDDRLIDTATEFTKMNEKTPRLHLWAVNGKVEASYEFGPKRIRMGYLSENIAPYYEMIRAVQKRGYVVMADAVISLIFGRQEPPFIMLSKPEHFLEIDPPPGGVVLRAEKGIDFVTARGGEKYQAALMWAFDSTLHRNNYSASVLVELREVPVTSGARLGQSNIELLANEETIGYLPARLVDTWLGVIHTERKNGFIPYTYANIEVSIGGTYKAHIELPTVKYNRLRQS